MALRRNRRFCGGCPALQVISEPNLIPNFCINCDMIADAVELVVSPNATSIPLEINITLCGNLPFCEPSANSHCLNTSITNCDQCSMPKGGVFAFFLIVLGLCIVVGNTIILAVGCLRYRKKILDKFDIAKSSLAVADMITGDCFKNRFGTKKNHKHWCFFVPVSDLDQNKIIFLC